MPHHEESITNPLIYEVERSKSKEHRHAKTIHQGHEHDVQGFRVLGMNHVLWAEPQFSKCVNGALLALARERQYDRALALDFD